jgi:iron-sulfur cluster assembly protein
MALDEPKDDDSVFDIEGFQYLVNNDLLEKAKPIKVDFQQVGFKIDSGLVFDKTDGCAGCSCD